MGCISRWEVCEWKYNKLTCKSSLGQTASGLSNLHPSRSDQSQRTKFLGDKILFFKRCRFTKRMQKVPAGWSIHVASTCHVKVRLTIVIWILINMQITEMTRTQFHFPKLQTFNCKNKRSSPQQLSSSANQVVYFKRPLFESYVHKLIAYLFVTFTP